MEFIEFWVAGKARLRPINKSLFTGMTPIKTLMTGKDYNIEEYKRRLAGAHELAHITVEINRCRSQSLGGH